MAGNTFKKHLLGNVQKISSGILSIPDKILSPTQSEVHDISDRTGDVIRILVKAEGSENTSYAAFGDTDTLGVPNATSSKTILLSPGENLITTTSNFMRIRTSDGNVLRIEILR